MPINVSRDREFAGIHNDGTIYIHSDVPFGAELLSEFTSMAAAVEEAIAQATKIRQNSGISPEKSSVEIRVRYPIILSPGSGLYPAGIIGHDPYDLSDQSLAELRQWAVEHDEKLPKCDHCGEIIGRETYTNSESEWTGFKFCSESCADHDYWEQRMHEEAEREESDDEYEAIFAEHETDD